MLCGVGLLVLDVRRLMILGENDNKEFFSQDEVLCVVCCVKNRLK